MLEVDKLTAVIILFLIFIALVAVCYLFYRKNQQHILRLEQQCTNYDALLEQLHHHFLSAEQLQKETISHLEKRIEDNQQEHSQVEQHLEFRIKKLQQTLADFESRISTLNAEQPADRLYSRAMKLVSLGADIEEIMQECEIPRAEAEMLLAMHSK